MLVASRPEGGPIARTGGQAGHRTGLVRERESPFPTNAPGGPDRDSTCWCRRRERGTPGRHGGGRRLEGHAALAPCGRHFGPGSCSERRVTFRGPCCSSTWKGVGSGDREHTAQGGEDPRAGVRGRVP